jgi:serine/threonine protein kinase
VRVYDVGEHAGLVYLAVELVAGGSLHHRTRGEPQPFDTAAKVVEELARAAAYLHRRGIVHRDLKPANVLLAPEPEGSEDPDRPSGGPKLTDYPRPLRLGAAGPAGRPGEIVGTPAFMAPEQAAGDPAVGPAADIWSLGAILYELLTGQPPVRGGGSVLEVLDRVRTADVAPPSSSRPGIPAELEAICLRCLRKEPAGRYSTAADLARALRRFLDAVAEPAPSPAAPPGP